MSELLEVKHLKKYFPIKGGFFRRTQSHLKAVDDVSFTIHKGKTLGLVGESGCGKSTLGKSILQLHGITEGDILLEGKSVIGLDHQAMKPIRRDMQIIFQDPYASLSPRRTIIQTLLEPLETHNIGDAQSRRQKVEELVSLVGLKPEVLHRYPHEFSGGQRQRIGIARALALEPKFIVADESVSALDVSVQSQVLNLMSNLQRKLGIAFLFISHDLAVVQHISHDVGVMYLGKLVELASAEDLYRDPKHPYTQALLSAIPEPEPERKTQQISLEGEVPSPLNAPSGCPFHTRCPKAMVECKTQAPVARNVGTEAQPHLVSCHLYAD